MSCNAPGFGQKAERAYTIQTSAAQAAGFYTKGADTSVVHTTRAKAFDVRLELLDLRLQPLTMCAVFCRIDGLPLQGCVFSS